MGNGDSSRRGNRGSSAFFCRQGTVLDSLLKRALDRGLDVRHERLVFCRRVGVACNGSKVRESVLAARLEGVDLRAPQEVWAPAEFVDEEWDGVVSHDVERKC